MIQVMNCQHFDVFVEEKGPEGQYIHTHLKESGSWKSARGEHTLFEIHKGNCLTVQIHYKQAGCEFSMTQGDYRNDYPIKHNSNPHIKMFMKQQGSAGKVLSLGYIIPEDDPEPGYTQGCTFFFGLVGGIMEDEEIRSFSCRYVQEPVVVRAHLSQYIV